MNKQAIRHWIDLFGPAATLLLLFGQLLFWQSPWFGWIILSLYVYFVGRWWQELWRRVFGLRQRAWTTRLLSYGTLFILLSLISAVAVAWYKLNDVAVWFSFFAAAAVTYATLFAVRASRGWQKRTIKLSGSASFSIVQKHWGLLGAYVVVWGAACYYLFQSRSADVLFSPWQTIHEYYLPLFFLLTLLLGTLLVSRYSIKILLAVVVAHTLLLHLYLPLSHSMPWGGDVWRHVGVEQQLVEGEHIYPVLLGDRVEKKEIGPFIVPTVLVAPQKYIYSQLWGVTTVFSKTVNSNLLTTNIWLVPLLWSLFLPLLLFRIGAFLFSSWRWGLLLAAIVQVAFPFQALGALSLPVSLGYITFFLGLAWWVQYLRTKNRLQQYVALGLGVLMFFGYPLHAILLWLTMLLSFLCTHLLKDRRWKVFSTQQGLHKKIGITLVAAASVLLFPVIELVSGISNVLGRYDAVTAAKQVLGQLSGWFYASAIRPHDILSGNIVFNHTPMHAFVETLFTQWRWFFIPTMIVLFACATCGLWRSAHEKHRVLWGTVALLLASTFGGYLVSWFVFGGDHLFVRRMDAMIVFLLLLFAMQGVRAFRPLKQNKQRVLVGFGVLVLAWIATATYASGPDMRVVSESEFDAASYTWQEEAPDTAAHCVIADTWTLLALEGVSGRRIVGGGFSIDYQFAQPERLRLYSELIVAPTQQSLTEAQERTGSDRCWIIAPKDHVGEDVQEALSALTNAEVQEVGELYLWRQAPPTEPLSESDGEG